MIIYVEDEVKNMEKIRHFLRILMVAVVLLIIIGIICYQNVSPIDAISGATSRPSGFQEGGALTYFLDGSGR